VRLREVTVKHNGEQFWQAVIQNIAQTRGCFGKERGDWHDVKHEAW